MGFFEQATDRVENSMNKALLIGIVLVIVFAVIPLTGSLYYVYLNTEVLITILFAISLNLLVGYSGLFSLGHAGFFGVGAYAYSILLMKVGLGFWGSFLIAPFVAAGAAVIIGYFCIRLTKIYFTMLTLAFAQIIWAIAFKWNSLTGGDSGMRNIMPPDYLLGINETYYFALAVVAVLAFVLHKISCSPFGLILKTTRENPTRTEFIGINVKRYHLIAFGLAGFFAGFAGVLYIISIHAIFPDMILVRKSVEVLVMCILGGMYNFLGPALGAAIIIFLNSFITSYFEYWSLILGCILAMLLFFFPDGILGITGRLIRRYREKRAKNAPARECDQVV